MGDLRDELLKAGLISQVDVDRLKQEKKQKAQRRSQPGRRGGAGGGDRQGGKRREGGKGKRPDRGPKRGPSRDGGPAAPPGASPGGHDGGAQRRRRPRRRPGLSGKERVLQLVRRNYVAIEPGDQALNFIVPGERQVRRIDLVLEQYQALVAGHLGLIAVDANMLPTEIPEKPASFGKRTRRRGAPTPEGGPAREALVPREAALEIREAESHRVLFLRKSADEPGKPAADEDLEADSGVGPEAGATEAPAAADSRSEESAAAETARAESLAAAAPGICELTAKGDPVEEGPGGRSLPSSGSSSEKPAVAGGGGPDSAAAAASGCSESAATGDSGEGCLNGAGPSGSDSAEATTD